jgi:hypothetical protein
MAFDKWAARRIPKSCLVQPGCIRPNANSWAFWLDSSGENGQVVDCWHIRRLSFPCCFGQYRRRVGNGMTTPSQPLLPHALNACGSGCSASIVPPPWRHFPTLAAGMKGFGLSAALGRHRKRPCTSNRAEADAENVARSPTLTGVLSQQQAYVSNPTSGSARCVV